MTDGAHILSDVTDELWDQLLAYQDQTFRSRAATLTSLAHYTSFAALKSIIETEELWFSSASTTNDVEEITRGKSMLERMTAEGQPLFSAINNIRELNGALWESLNSNYRNRHFGDLFHTYISCWSECDLATRSHDDLTMWRGYAADGNGVAIVVDAQALGLDAATRSEIVICPVFYESDAQFADRAKLAFQIFRDAMAQMQSAISGNDQLVASAFGELCFYLAVTHKHLGFAPEKEWRFAWSKHRDPTEQGLRRHLRPVLQNGDLIEKFCFPIQPDPTVTPVPLDLRNLLQSVMIGPCDDDILKRDAVVSLLRSRGFPTPENLVTHTEIPYRSAR